jgi:hypothetical protein
MATCQNCRSADVRPTKKLCTACYDYERRTGRHRPEATVIKHNRRRFEQTHARCTDCPM